MHHTGLSSDLNCKEKKSYPETGVSEISQDRLQGYLYFSSGKLKFLLNFNTHSKKCFTQQRALHEIICCARCNEHLPRLISIWLCIADTRRPGNPHLGLPFLQGAIRLPYLREKWHLLKILKHATLGWDLESSLENNSRLCGSLRLAGQHAPCYRWQGAIRWETPQAGPFTVAVNKSQPVVSPDWDSQGLAPVPSGISGVLPRHGLLSQWGLFFVLGRIPPGKVEVGAAQEREHPRPLNQDLWVCYSLHRSPGPTFLRKCFSFILLQFSHLFKKKKKSDWFSVSESQTFVKVFKILPWEIRE